MENTDTEDMVNIINIINLDQDQEDLDLLEDTATKHVLNDLWIDMNQING